MGWEGREARDAGRGTHRAARQRHLTDATLHVYGQCKGCSSRDIWLHITLIGLPEPRTATSGAADWNMEFHRSGCGRGSAALNRRTWRKRRYRRARGRRGLFRLRWLVVFPYAIIPDLKQSFPLLVCVTHPLPVLPRAATSPPANGCALGSPRARVPS